MNKAEVPVIRASEIGQYLYCARSWWLERVQGQPSAHRQEMARGREEHVSHGRAVADYQTGRWLGYALLALAAIVGILLVGAAFFRGG
jgi:hypothetical protein